MLFLCGSLNTLLGALDRPFAPGVAHAGLGDYTCHELCCSNLTSRIPNLALMRLSTYYKKLGFEVLLAHRPSNLKAHQYLASAIFHCELTKRKIAQLRGIYGADVQIGGSGVDLAKRRRYRRSIFLVNRQKRGKQSFKMPGLALRGDLYSAVAIEKWGSCNSR